MIRIGIVDDEKQERDQLKQALARFGAENGTELNVQEFDCAAVYLAAQDRDFDILYLDIDMPQMSGMELAEKIRETDQDVILIFCTNLQQFALNGYSVGALGFIVKPIQRVQSLFHLYPSFLQTDLPLLLRPTKTVLSYATILSYRVTVIKIDCGSI